MNKLEMIQQSKIPEKAVAAITVATGVGALLDKLPQMFGLVATSLGIILTIMLIYKTSITIRRERLELAHSMKRRKTDKKVKK